MKLKTENKGQKALGFFASWYLLLQSAMAQSDDILSGMTQSVGTPLWKIIAIITVILLAIETVVIVVMVQTKKIDGLAYWIIGAVVIAAAPAILGSVYQKWAGSNPFGGMYF